MTAPYEFLLDGFFADAESPAPLTVRNRFILTVEAETIADSLSLDLTRGLLSDIDHSMQVRKFPSACWGQPEEWWDALVMTSRSLGDTFAYGGALRSKTVAESAVIHLCIESMRRGCVDFWREDVKDYDDGLGNALYSLEAHPLDEDWDAVAEAIQAAPEVAQMWALEPTYNSPFTEMTHTPNHWFEPL